MNKNQYGMELRNITITHKDSKYIGYQIDGDATVYRLPAYFFNKFDSVDYGDRFEGVYGETKMGKFVYPDRKLDENE